MKAPAQDQTRLLQVQARDTALHQLAHKRARLPQLAGLRAVAAKQAAASEELEVARVEARDEQRELTRLEDDIAKVEARAVRDKARLDSGGGLSRELQALQQDLEILARRRARLEDEALEAMERVESGRSGIASLEASLAALDAEAAGLEAELAAATAELDRAAAAEAVQRAAAAEGLDAGLVKLYERLRQRLGGVGAAALSQGRCGGCGFQLSASELAAIKSLGADEVARCEECTRILVRGEDSGL
ncbi:MAG: C4-type zinc ribbon domain-containing protein [Bifidobacteriaceae bacterium]|nr:C4-type zinc ribbon domain-containing protein [Bifidobacteriaceae bacterium]